MVGHVALQDPDYETPDPNARDSFYERFAEVSAETLDTMLELQPELIKQSSISARARETFHPRPGGPSAVNRDWASAVPCTNQRYC